MVEFGQSVEPSFERDEAGHLHRDVRERAGGVWKGVKEMPIKEIPEWVRNGRSSPTGRHTFTTFKHWDKNDELLPSGLLGPVKLHVRSLLDR